MKSKTEILTELMQLKSAALQKNDDLMIDVSRKMISVSEANEQVKRLLIIYASGSIGANNKLQLPRGQLKKHFMKNFYFCDYPQSLKQNPSLDVLISPKFDNGVRILYQIQEIKHIESSIKLNIESIAEVAKIIENNYRLYDSFLIIFGMDTICYFASALSFMFQNLDKLVICSGGYLPLSKMRNQSAMNLVESFAAVAEVSSLNDILIISKNKGYRGNRCIKKSQGDFQSITSPNLPAILSIKTKLRLRSYLLQPRPTGEFSVFYGLSHEVKFLCLNFYETLESIEYELNNPYIKGIVIQSYSFANIPNNQKLLNLFKKAHEEKGIIFINISQSVKAHNQSLMSEYLKGFHVHYGGDMTPHAAIAKLSYLLGKKLPTEQIIKMISKNLRGELTELKDNLQFEASHTPLMTVVAEVIHQQYPTNLKDSISSDIEKKLLIYLIEKCSFQEFRRIFGHELFEHVEEAEQFNDQTCKQIPIQNKLTKIEKFIESHEVLHMLAQKGNVSMFQEMLCYARDINALDKSQCSPMFYALENQDKQLIHLLKKNQGRVRVPTYKLFQLFTKHLKKDDVRFFQLLVHTQFRHTLKKIQNMQKRKVTHIAALLKAYKCYQYLDEKLMVPCDVEDIYEKTAINYLKSTKICPDKKSKSEY